MQRNIDDLWFSARILRPSSDEPGTFDVEYTDDGNIEVSGSSDGKGGKGGLLSGSPSFCWFVPSLRESLRMSCVFGASKQNPTHPPLIRRTA